MVRNTGIFKCFISCVYAILKTLNGIQHLKKIHLRETNLNCSIKLSKWYSRFLNLNKVSICSVVQESQGKLLESKREGGESEHTHIYARLCFICEILLKQTQVLQCAGSLFETHSHTSLL